ncbi:MAG TPA: YqeG family HAD IIIA-type phosphatase [Candidatus Xenobia bacterium]|jgi:hypothetical protein
MKPNLEMLCPQLFLPRIEDIRLDELKSRGYRALIVDLDNTLVSWKSWRVQPAVRAWLEQAKALGFQICIVSNGLIKRRIEMFSRDLGIPAIPKALKPKPNGFLEALERMGSSVRDTVVVGDQLFTDVLGGNLLGLLTILVLPVDTNELFATIITRTQEKLALLRLRRAGRLTRHLAWPEEFPLPSWSANVAIG